MIGGTPRAADRRWLLAIIVGLLCASLTISTVHVAATPVAPPTTIVTSSPIAADSIVQVNFPTGITVASTLSWNGDGAIGRLELLYSSPGSSTATIAYSQPRQDSGPFQSRLETSIDLGAHYLPSGIELSLWWRLTGPEGTTIAESEAISILWMDDSQSWQESTSEQVILYSYALSEAFIAETLSSLQDTIDALEARYDLAMPESVRVWVYENYDDFRAAMPPNSRESIAALAFPGFHTIAAIVPNGNTAEMLRVLPHEISHQVLYQAAANPFSPIPVWLDEGLATHVQTGGTSGYLEMVTRAHDRGELFRLDSLNAGFPFNPAQATLAYATSWSAITYIDERWGDEGIAALVDAFAIGLPYGDALQAALGFSAAELNDDWTAWVDSQ